MRQSCSGWLLLDEVTLKLLLFSAVYKLLQFLIISIHLLLTFGTISSLCNLHICTIADSNHSLVI